MNYKLIQNRCDTYIYGHNWIHTRINNCENKKLAKIILAYSYSKIASAASITAFAKSSTELKMTTQDKQSISNILKYAKSEWLNYEDNFTIIPSALKSLKKNYFASKSWEDEGVRILQVISKNWNLNYRWK